MDMKQVLIDCGYDVVETMDVSTLEFMDDVRSMCAADRCHAYGKTWSCPPAIGSLDEMREKASHYSKGFLMQTLGEREDTMDWEAMMEAADKNKEHGEKFVEYILANKLDCFFMTSGACTRCEKCTYPDAPCRFPDRVYPSMEACGLFVSKVCTDNGVKYNYGAEIIAYTSCLLYND